jgi:hypothetical protein
MVDLVLQVQLRELLLRTLVGAPDQETLGDGAEAEGEIVRLQTQRKTLVGEAVAGMVDIVLQEMVDQALLLFPMRRTAAMESQHLQLAEQLPPRQAEEFTLSLQLEHLCLCWKIRKNNLY